jgi:hypothetical protein
VLFGGCRIEDLPQVGYSLCREVTASSATNLSGTLTIARDMGMSSGNRHIGYDMIEHSYVARYVMVANLSFVAFYVSRKALKSLCFTENKITIYHRTLWSPAVVSGESLLLRVLQNSVLEEVRVSLILLLRRPWEGRTRRKRIRKIRKLL